MNDAFESDFARREFATQQQEIQARVAFRLKLVSQGLWDARKQDQLTKWESAQIAILKDSIFEWRGKGIDTARIFTELNVSALTNDLHSVAPNLFSELQQAEETK